MTLKTHCRWRTLVLGMLGTVLALASPIQAADVAMCDACGDGQRAERRNEHEPCPECAGGARTHNRLERAFGPVAPCLRGVGWTAVVEDSFVGAAREDEFGHRTLLVAGYCSADAAHSSRFRGLDLAGVRHVPGGFSVQATPQPSGHRDRGTASEGFDVLARYEDNRNGRITCKEARRHGIARVPRSHPAYRYMRDGDGDGVVCE